MEVRKKEGIRGIRIAEHNKKLFYAIMILLVLLAIVCILYFRESRTEADAIAQNNSCSNNEDCIPASCCHASSCASSISKPDCDGVKCTQECKPGTMDCGQGRCECLNNKCSAVLQ